MSPKIPKPEATDDTARNSRAVIYLRVSTKEQAERGGEAEGFSIPAQREACLRKAASIGAVVVDEFADRGESAKTAARPALQEMLKYIKQEGVQFRNDVVKGPGGAQVLAVDPSGNLVEVFQPATPSR